MIGAQPWSDERLARLRTVMTGFVERRELAGIVTALSRQGTAHIDTFGASTLDGSRPMRRDTIFRIASLTKLITAAAAMILVEECRLRLDDPVDAFLPELANRRVLKRLDGPIDDTVPARRAITLRDLLTLRMGIGHPMVPPGTYPIQEAINAAGVLQGPPRPASLPTTDEWIRRVGTLPLLAQPGERWLYDLGLDVLGVLIARVTGKSFGAFLQERLFGPLGMKDTAFHVPAEKLDRLGDCYSRNAATGELIPYDLARQTEWARPPRFESGAGGLVSTADDLLTFKTMLLNRGRHGREQILARASVELMTADHVSAAERQGMEMFFDGNTSWGFGVAVSIRRDDLSGTPGRFGWTGGLGLSGYVDPREGLVGILLTQRLMDGPVHPPVFQDFWTSTYQALGD